MADVPQKTIEASLSYSLQTLFAIVTGVAALIAWFSDGSGIVVSPNDTVITNDALHWPKLERLRSDAEYQDWCDRVPDGAAWALPQIDEPIPDGVNSVSYTHLTLPTKA